MSEPSTVLPGLHLRADALDLLALPWDLPLHRWDNADQPLRHRRVAQGQHPARLVEVDGRCWTLTQMPWHVATDTHALLSMLESRSVAAARPAGLVTTGAEDTAVVITCDPPHAVPYTKLLTGGPGGAETRRHLLDAVATLLVDLHRNDATYGAHGLHRTLFSPDGHTLQAWLTHPATGHDRHEAGNGRLDDDRRRRDLDLLAGELTHRLPDTVGLPGTLADRYHRLWNALHREIHLPITRSRQLPRPAERLRRLGYTIDEIHLRSIDDTLHLAMTAAARRSYSRRLHALTGVTAGEGQARILLADLHAHHLRLQHSGTPVSEADTAHEWVRDVLYPALNAIRAEGGHTGDALQTYCERTDQRTRPAHPIPAAPGLAAQLAA
jgi:Domain of unknown function (DUF4032)